MNTLIAIASLGVLMSMNMMAQSVEPDPCKLISPADVSKVLGEGFKKVIARGECSFVRGTDSVNMSVRKSPGPVAKVIAPQRDATQGAKPITGACEVGFSRPSGSVLAGKGAWLVLTESRLAGKGDAANAVKMASLLCSKM